jgi:hypothetical protein
MMLMVEPPGLQVKPLPPTTAPEANCCMSPLKWKRLANLRAVLVMGASVV